MAAKPTGQKATKKKSESIKDDLAVVRVIARCGRLPLVSDDVEWINPTTSRVVPGEVLEFEDGVCELHPIHDAKKIKLLEALLEDGRDERILELGLFIAAKDALLPPFPKWDVTADSKLTEVVETLGLDPEMCLRYELQKGDEARPGVIKALEKVVDTPPADDPLSEPSL